MTGNGTFIQLHRKILENPIASNANYAWLLVTLLLLANHKDNTFMHGNELITTKRGQLLTGRKQLAKQTGIKESTIQRILLTFEKMQIIEQQTNNRYRLITILNYDKYQGVNNNRTTTEQQLNTNNNDNNDNNKHSDKITTLTKFKNNKDSILKDATKKYGDTKDVEKAITNFIEQNEIKSYKYKDYKLAFYKWVRDDKFNEFSLSGYKNQSQRTRL